MRRSECELVVCVYPTCIAKESMMVLVGYHFRCCFTGRKYSGLDSPYREDTREEGDHEERKDGSRAKGSVFRSP